MVLVVLLDISVNFTDQKNVEKCLNFLCIISFHSRTIEDKLKPGTINAT